MSRKKLLYIIGLLVISAAILLWVQSFILPPSDHSVSSAANIPPAPEASSGFTSKKSVIAENYMAVTAHPEASRAAATLLADGGSAVDAAIAAQMVLNVVEPQSSGMGGGGFMLHYEAETNTISSYDGREIAPEKFNLSPFYAVTKVESGDAGKPRAANLLLPFGKRASSAHAVGVPGVLAMLEKAHTAHGEKPWGALFEPAITLANNGFSVTPRLRALLEYGMEFHGAAPFVETYLLPDGTLPPVGHLLRNPALAESLRTVSSQGADALYRGALGESIVAAVQKKRGSLSESDLLAYQALQHDALCMPYRTYRLCTAPPPAGGLVVLQAMGMLTHFDMAALRSDPLETAHLIAEATKLAFADRAVYMGDAPAMTVAAEQLLNPAYMKHRVQSIDRGRAMKAAQAGNPSKIYHAPAPPLSLEQPSTTHMSIVDRQGNIVSMTTSIEHAFGSGMNVEGFFLNNQLTDFSYPAKAPEPTLAAPDCGADQQAVQPANFPAPHKRPRSSMSPMVVFDAQNNPLLVIGSPGGSRIIPYILQNLVRVLDQNASLQKSIHMPHMLALSDRLELEAGQVTPKMASALQAKGHMTTHRPHVSGLHAILFEGERLIGAADPRREGVAIGE